MVQGSSSACSSVIVFVINVAYLSKTCPASVSVAPWLLVMINLTFNSSSKFLMALDMTW